MQENHQKRIPKTCSRDTEVLTPGTACFLAAACSSLSSSCGVLTDLQNLQRCSYQRVTRLWAAHRGLYSVVCCKYAWFLFSR
jgi:hypothetical protein